MKYLQYFNEKIFNKSSNQKQNMLEPKINNLLLESNIKYSDNFIKVLKKINNKVSKEILSLHNQDKKIIQNYIDIDLNKNNLITFIPNNKSLNIDNVWDYEYRKNSMNIGRYVRSILKHSDKTFTDIDIENFVNKYKAVIDSMDSDIFSNFEIVTGEKIVQIYNELERDKEAPDQLTKSCMNSKPREFFELYRLNPGIVRMVIMKEDNEILGRALLWDTDNGFKFMDRIYTIKESDIQLFKLYADKMGFWYKDRQTTSYRRRGNFTYNFDMVLNGVKKREDIIVQLNSWSVDYYPYLDTLCYFNRETGKLSNNRFLIDADVLLCNMNGGYKNSNFRWKFEQ